jgi:hypothetical protein
MHPDDGSGSDVVPRPDPTRLTTLAVDRALSGFRELIEARLDGIDRATDLVAKDSARIAASQERNRELLRDDVARQLEALERLIDERFARVDDRFADRDASTKLAAEESRIQLKAALDAAKEVVGEQNKFISRVMEKSEGQWAKQIDAMVALMDERQRTNDQRYQDLKERLDLGGGLLAGAQEQRTEARLSTGQMLVAAMVLIGIFGLAITLLTRS